MKKRIVNLILAFFTVLIPLTLLFGLLNYCGYQYYLLDNISNFRFQVFILGLLLLIGSIVLFRVNRKYSWMLFVVIIGLIINYMELYPYFNFNKPSLYDESAGFKVLLTNILTSNARYNSVIKLINKEKPDIVVIQEVNVTWIDKLKELKKAYIYGIDCPRADNYGISVYSKIPIRNVSIAYYTFQDIFVPYITFETSIDKQKVNFIAFHTIPPFNSKYFAIRNDQLKAISSWVKNSKYPVVVLGDLNVSPFSHYYKNMANNSGLIDSRKGFGIYPSWPTSLPSLFRLPLDLILHTKELKTVYIKTGEPIGSDHLPVIAKIVHNNKQLQR